MTSLSLDSSKSISATKATAQHLASTTPRSFRQISEIKKIFDHRGEQLEDICLKLENYSCLPVLPTELFAAVFEEVKCADPTCSMSFYGLDSLTHALAGANTLPIFKSLGPK